MKACKCTHRNIYNTYYHCILHSKAMFPSKSCKTATPLLTYRRTYYLLQYIYMLQNLFAGNFKQMRLWNILLYPTFVNENFCKQNYRSIVSSGLKLLSCPKRTILSFRLTNKMFAHTSFTTACNYCVWSPTSYSIFFFISILYYYLIVKASTLFVCCK